MTNHDQVGYGISNENLHVSRVKYDKHFHDQDYEMTSLIIGYDSISEMIDIIKKDPLLQCS